MLFLHKHVYIAHIQHPGTWHFQHMKYMITSIQTSIMKIISNCYAKNMLRIYIYSYGILIKYIRFDICRLFAYGAQRRCYEQRNTNFRFKDQTVINSKIAVTMSGIRCSLLLSPPLSCSYCILAPVLPQSLLPCACVVVLCMFRSLNFIFPKYFTITTEYPSFMTNLCRNPSPSIGLSLCLSLAYSQLTYNM